MDPRGSYQSRLDIRTRLGSFIPVVIAGVLVAVFVSVLAGSAGAQSPPPNTVSLTPTDDAYVSGSFPNTNYGAGPILRSDGSPPEEAYLKFDLGQLAGRFIVSAKLQIYVANGSAGVHSVRSVADRSWTEAGLDWANRPSKGPTVAAFIPGPATGIWREVDVTSAAAGQVGSTLSLALSSNSADAFHFHSKNVAANAPVLVVESSSGPTPSPSPTPVGPPVLVGAGDIATGGAAASRTAAIIAALPASAHVFTLGDHAYQDGTPTQFNKYYEPTWGQFKGRTHPLVGNHDSHTFGAPGYFNYFEPHTHVGYRGEGWYAYDLSNWRVIVLNSECNGTPYDFCDHAAQKAWLEAELAANPRSCTVAMWHRPMVAPSSNHTDNDGNFLDVWQLLHDAGADLVLGSHDHLYARFAPYNRDANGVAADGMRQFVVGTGGASLYPLTETSKPGLEAGQGSTHGVLKLTLNDRTYDWEFLPVAGATYTDSGTSACHEGIRDPAPPPTPTPSPGAGVSFEGSSNTINTTASTSLVLTQPPGTTAGDVLVASVAINGSTLKSAPPGWVRIAAVTSATNPKLYAYYRVFAVGDPATYSWTFNAPVTSSGGIARYAGVNTTNPLQTAVSTATAPTPVTSLTVPGVTTVSPGSMLIGAAAINASPLNVLITSPAGTTERWDLGGKRQDYADTIRLAAGSSGAKTWAFSSTRAAAGWLAALNPQ